MKTRYFDHPASRREALSAATHEHDGAWRDPLALTLMAQQYGVDEQWLTTEASRVVAAREVQRNEARGEDGDLQCENA
ncbi:hypothetical protein KDW82_34490 [Burkholderia vietnamiensis]|uniref:hypothetical protein n=1 Tax=Burkholderia vietnamiensis TaxID=60552 RepID=UPI001B91D36F|nr:hypothetical protein [Burkholderia vietnamiensis]MBR8194122.1 hypothetical protein [Burkholderia vietnamiensis]